MARAALIRIDPERVRGNLEEVREEIGQAAAEAGRSADAVEILAAVKYVASEDLPALAAGGVRLVGENRAQDLVAKMAAHGPLFEWDFIGQLQSRRVALLVPRVRLIHSLASESAARALARCLEDAHDGDAGRSALQRRADLGVLVQVNVAEEPGKAGVLPRDLDSFLAQLTLPVRGLMTMPPAVEDPERSRRWFAALRELAEARGLAELSMGTTQDYRVAVAEGATVVRIGNRLYV